MKPVKSRAKQRTLSALLGIAALIVLLAGWLWMSPSGTGEYRNSPDGKYQATADNMSKGTFSLKRDRYVKLSVHEQATDQPIWQIELRWSKTGLFWNAAGDSPSSAKEALNYADRSRKFIVWAIDSSSVKFPISATQQITVPMP